MKTIVLTLGNELPALIAQLAMLDAASAKAAAR
jgi:hypothetical protein